MLSLNLILFNTTLRAFPYWRLCSLLSTSVVNPETTNLIKPNENITPKEDKYAKKTEISNERKSQQTEVSQIMASSKKVQNRTFITLDERIINTRDTKDLINIMNDPNITIDQVKQILSQISSLKTNKTKQESAVETKESFKEKKINFDSGTGFLPLATPKLIQILKKLSFNNDRNVPLLKTLTYNIAMYSSKLNTRMCGDILYSLAVLNYSDEVLLEKIMLTLLEELPCNNKGPIISSIATSLRLLKYKNHDVLDTIYVWANNNLENLRFKDFSAILQCFAIFGYVPKNFDNLQDYINLLTPKVTSDNQLWLDFVWSLTLLNRASQEHVSSVLNYKFSDRILYKSNQRSIGNILKLLNINAFARTIIKDYNGQYIKNKNNIFNTVVKTDKQKLELIDVLTETLKEIAPSCFQKDINTQMGFNIDIECCLNSENQLVKCNDDSSSNIRLAIMVHCYHDYSRGKEEILGIAKFYNDLLIAQGYRVLNVSYQNLSVNDILAKRVKYIKDKLKISSM